MQPVTHTYIHRLASPSINYLIVNSFLKEVMFHVIIPTFLWFIAVNVKTYIKYTRIKV